MRRILDVGCGRGGVLRDLRRGLHIDVVGVDLRPLLPPVHPAGPERALGGTAARFRHSVAPLYIRQILDVTYPR